MPDSELQVVPARAFADNYIWMVSRPGSAFAAAVDPGDAGPVLAWCAREGKRLCAVLITHHHGDHVGGIERLKLEYPDLAVHGPARERIPGITTRHGEGDCIDLPEIGARFTVLDVPGHTAGHIAYLGHGCLFCGDTLFANGCGRVFDGSFEALAASLKRIAGLPGETLLFCAHEYTLDNIGFAKWVEPANPDLLAREAADWEKLERGAPTVPSTLELERRTNPFLRWDAPEVRAAAERHAGRSLAGQAEVFTELRRWKDTEYD